MRKRTQAREVALQLLYESDARGAEALGDIDLWLAELAPDPEVAGYARELVLGAVEMRTEIDRRIEEVAHNWEVSRMSVVDRNVLRLAVFELLHRPDVPAAVVLDEAIEMAKRYSTKQSGSFVNGILDAIRQRHIGGPPKDVAPDGPAGPPQARA